ncbi:M23 family metallopeptidase [Capnocytophaga cynodegmi]|uniref:M23 family metallopeptidase n=1 Tax=Capnocytophaga cynodegmi TaxID=28189 RepID=UPI00385B3D7C
MKRVFTGKCRNPIDNAILCLYSQGGESKKTWHGSFRKKIRDNVNNHTGIDLLAVPGTPVYACLTSKVDRIYTSGSLAGKTVVLEVLDKETFKLMRRDYTPKYANKGEILQQNFDEDKKVYLVFWHLSKNDFFKVGDIVEPNDVIGLTGVSGKGGVDFETCNPHLHFEVNNVGSVPGLEEKCNPCVYFRFKTEDDLTKEEIEYQEKLKDKNNWQ